MRHQVLEISPHGRCQRFCAQKARPYRTAASEREMNERRRNVKHN
jgi:hypothetical protein